MSHGFIHTSIEQVPVLRELVLQMLPEFHGLTIDRDDVIELEHIALGLVAADIRETVGQIHAQLAAWHDERVLRPERVRAARERMRRSPLRHASSNGGLKPVAPMWQRQGRYRGIVRPGRDPRLPKRFQRRPQWKPENELLDWAARVGGR